MPGPPTPTKRTSGSRRVSARARPAPSPSPEASAATSMMVGPLMALVGDAQHEQAQLVGGGDHRRAVHDQTPARLADHAGQPGARRPRRWRRRWSAGRRGAPASAWGLGQHALAALARPRHGLGQAGARGAAWRRCPPGPRRPAPGRRRPPRPGRCPARRWRGRSASARVDVGGGCRRAATAPSGPSASSQPSPSTAWAPSTGEALLLELGRPGSAAGRRRPCGRRR